MAPVKGFTEERLMKKLLPEVWAGMKKGAGGGETPRDKRWEVIRSTNLQGEGETLWLEPIRKAIWQNTATTHSKARKGGSRKGTGEWVL